MGEEASSLGGAPISFDAQAKIIEEMKKLYKPTHRVTRTILN